MKLKLVVFTALAALRRRFSAKQAVRPRRPEKGRPLDQNSELVPPFPPF